MRQRASCPHKCIGALKRQDRADFSPLVVSRTFFDSLFWALERYGGHGDEITALTPEVLRFLV